MVVKVEGAVVRLGFSDPQRHPHHQYPYHHALEIASGLLVGDYDDEAGQRWNAGSSGVVS